MYDRGGGRGRGGDMYGGGRGRGGDMYGRGGGRGGDMYGSRGGRGGELYGSRGGLGGPGRSAASSLLQKVNSQLRGERVSSRGPEEDDEDDLTNYLSSLGKKKAPSTNQPRWDKFGEPDALSASDDDKNNAPAQGASLLGSGSKFLKKKAAPASTEAKAGSVGAGNKPTGQQNQRSGVLGKAAMYTNKYGGSGASKAGAAAYGSKAGVASGPRADGAYITGSGAAYGSGGGGGSSDSDMEMSMDEEVLADVRSWKKGPASGPATKKSKSSALKNAPQQRAPPRTVDSDDSSSMNIGRGGSKFLKKKPATPQPESEPEEIQEESPKKVRRSVPDLRTSEKFYQGVTMDSDDDSMAEFIGGLSGSSSSRTPRTPRGSAGPLRTPHQASDPHIPEEPDSEGQGHSDADSSSDDFKLKIMDLDELEPAISLEPSTKRKPNKKSTSKKPKDKAQTSAKEMKKKSSDNDILHELGLQTVDDLFGSVEDLSVASEIQTAGVTSEIRTEADDDSDDGRAVTPLKSILATPRSPKATPRSARGRVRYSLNEVTGMRSRSPSPEVILTAHDSASASRIYTEEFNDPTLEVSTARSVPEIDDRSGGEDTYSEDYTEDFSTASGQSSPGRGRSSPERSRSGYSSPDSSAHRRSRDSDNYSDDFTTGTEASQSHGISRSSSRESADYSDSYSSPGGSSRSRTPSPDRRQRRTVKQRSCEVQTGLDMGLLYHWNTQTGPMAVLGPQYGMAFVDPTPIATHVVSPEALEAVTAYSPSVLALNDMLRQQLALTTNFIETQKQLHRNYMEMARCDHQYTTLKDTKEYIKKHKKPTISFKQALKQVKAEMGLK